MTKRLESISTNLLETKSQNITLNISQVWRKHLYTDDSQSCYSKDREIVTAEADDLGKIFGFLIKLMSSLSSHDIELGQLQCANRRLLAEIELFSNCVAKEHKA